MDRLLSMGVFVAVAEEESFAGAARRLAMSPPAVTRTIAALEGHLGVKLLNRTTRYVRVTEAGQRYLDDSRRVIAAADEADEAAAGVNAAPRGHVTITAPVSFGRLHVMPCVVEYLARYPETEVNALLLDRVVNLVEEGVDVGVRIGNLPDASFKALRVGQIRRVLCAAPDYLAQHDEPTEPQQLAAHQIIAATSVSPMVEWRFGLEGAEQSVRIRPRLTVTNNDAAIAAAVRGAGIARLLSYQVASAVAEGTLRIVMAAHEPPPMPIHVIHREGRQASAKVRALVDLLVEHLRAERSLQPG
ncbi:MULTISPECIES: LysR family transcriptional regulator [unclassified Uliginosibacterium]|jgi:DNA-binding transcriptional LysR family regulator|uniref:LysR family transcriptional regulator n=1 Tax=unclassified Uliginosibacterium TaxID=2621521 RepID=UPI000C7AE9FE|nr:MULTISPECIES: LysR family transcriptional regulator [unclassified Uliginosibacterium]MDO6386306.1 LysR family transcriptional regulator [Uliginosibacterium sp. 31-12]PLK49374.1 LysR family transcriptional regulator [Uliginosibacterium sp. TH139]